MAFLIYLACVALLVGILTKIRKIGSREKALPPGPPTVPLLGNLHVFPTKDPHHKFTEWASEYGDIYSLKTGSGSVIILTSMKAVRELLDKRGNTTGDRPAMHVIEIVTGGVNMALANGEVWQMLRKVVHQILLAPKFTSQHASVQHAEATQLMYDLLRDPNEFHNHIQRYSLSTVMSIIYGKRCPRSDSKTITLFAESHHLWAKAIEPGATPPVDMFPILQRVPLRWAPWKALCAKVRDMQRELYFGLLEECELRVRQEKSTGSFIEQVVQRREELGVTREMVGYLGGVMLEGGGDTTSSVLITLVLYLAAYPAVQKKAQQEIDRVIGSERTPRLDDFKELPYIQAILREITRLRPPAPIAVPHQASKDEEYRGYVIPSGSVIFINVWGINHDPNVFEDPESFNPERFMRNEFGVKAGVDTSDFRHTLMFGAGRRMCPGIAVATNSLMINAMNLLWGFDFSPAIDPKTGLEIPVDVGKYCTGILLIAEPFECTITSRSAARAELIRHEFLEAGDAFRPFERSMDLEDREWIHKHRGSS